MYWIYLIFSTWKKVLFIFINDQILSDKKFFVFTEIYISCFVQVYGKTMHMHLEVLSEFHDKVLIISQAHYCLIFT